MESEGKLEIKKFVVVKKYYLIYPYVYQGLLIVNEHGVLKDKTETRKKKESKKVK